MTQWQIFTEFSRNFLRISPDRYLNILNLKLVPKSAKLWLYFGILEDDEISDF